MKHADREEYYRIWSRVSIIPSVNAGKHFNEIIILSAANRITNKMLPGNFNAINRTA
jgi:hypothetical protein